MPRWLDLFLKYLLLWLVTFSVVWLSYDHISKSKEVQACIKHCSPHLHLVDALYGSCYCSTVIDGKGYFSLSQSSDKGVEQ